MGGSVVGIWLLLWVLGGILMCPFPSLTTSNRTNGNWISLFLYASFLIDIIIFITFWISFRNLKHIDLYKKKSGLNNHPLLVYRFLKMPQTIHTRDSYYNHNVNFIYLFILVNHFCVLQNGVISFRKIGKKISPYNLS